MKENYEVMKARNEPDNKIDAKKKKQLEEQNKYAYIIRNVPRDCVHLTKALRRDVMEDEILMKKRYNVIYSMLEGR